MNERPDWIAWIGIWTVLAFCVCAWVIFARVLEWLV